MKVTNKAYNVAAKYLNSSYMEKACKHTLSDDLEIMGITAKPWLDEKTLRDIAIVTSRRIVESRYI